MDDITSVITPGAAIRRALLRAHVSLSANRYPPSKTRVTRLWRVEDIGAETA
jgi:hypothetical protein